MARFRARGKARQCAAVLGATLLVAAIVPLPIAAASPAKPKFSHVATRPDVAVAHVSGAAASRLPRRITPASKQLPMRAHPASTGAAPKPPTVSPSAVSPKARTGGATVSPAVVTLPPLTVTHVTNTQSQRDVLLEPPDPWVVANGSYVLSTSNGLIRVLNRGGALLADIPTYALFDTDLMHFDSDPRILWDAAHGRWVGVVVTYDDNFVDTSLTLAVSNTANPLGMWTTHRYNYGSELPDYPGIASTTDKVVLTANLYSCNTCTQSAYDGSSYQVVSWPSLIAGGSAASASQTCPACWNLRPARNSGTPIAAAYLVFEDVALGGDLWFMPITGTPTSPTAGAPVDLGIADGYYGPDGASGFDHQPRQPGGTIAEAVDGRIPDVVMTNSTLYFARTNQADLGGASKDLILQVYTVPVASALAATPTNVVQTVGSANTDYWMPGVGASNGDPTAGPGYFLSYMLSSGSVAPQAFAAGSVDGNTFTNPILVSASSGPYSASYRRWGDFMGITPDPGGTMAVWSATEVATADGQWQEVVDRLVLDDTEPSTPGIPSQALVAGSSLGTTNVPVAGSLNLPIRISWGAASDLQSGIRNYLVADELNHGAVAASSSITMKLPAFAYASPQSRSTDFSACAQNDAALWSLCSDYGLALTPTVFQQTQYTTYSSGWGTSLSSVFLGGSAKSSSTAGASASFRMSGRSFAWVALKASTRGKARVYVDGYYKGTVILTSSATQYRNLVYAINFGSSATHTVRIVVVSGRVDVDGFVVLR